MADVFTAAIEGVTRTWKQEAHKRRQFTKTDPVADTLEYCAGELDSRLESLKESMRRLSVEQFAKREGVTPQTVRNWIRRGLIQGDPTSKGYVIEATQIAPKRRSA